MIHDSQLLTTYNSWHDWPQGLWCPHAASHGGHGEVALLWSVRSTVTILVWVSMQTGPATNARLGQASPDLALIQDSGYITFAACSMPRAQRFSDVPKPKLLTLTRRMVAAGLGGCTSMIQRRERNVAFTVYRLPFTVYFRTQGFQSVNLRFWFRLISYHMFIIYNIMNYE